MLIVFPRIQTNWIHPLTRFFASLACHRLLSASFLVLGGPACAPKSKRCKPWTWCKRKCMVYIEMVSMWTYVILDVPRVYGTGCARSNFTTCIPVPWGGWSSLARFKHLFLGYSILSKSVFWPVLPQPYNQPEASGQAYNILGPPVLWRTLYMAHLRMLKSDNFFDVVCTKEDPICLFFNHWA